MSEQDIAAVQAAAMSAENRRRQLASERPGHGAPLGLPEVNVGPGVGIADLGLAAVGEGLSVSPVASDAQVAAYVMPNYAPDLVGGINFVGGRQEAPVRRHVHDLGDGTLFIEGRSAPVADGFTVLSAPSRPSLWSRLAGWLRK